MQKWHHNFITMRNVVFPLIILFCFSAFSQEKGSISVDFGSWRTKYLYPITNVRYESPYFLKNVQVQARLRSYGTLFFASKDGYDISPIVTYRFQKAEKSTAFHVGLGVDTRIRLVKDSRAHVSSSAEPFVYADFQYAFKKFQLKIPIWNRYYANGFGVSVLPEIRLNVGKQASIFTRLEVNYMAIYGYEHAVTNDVFLGFCWRFKP